MSVLDPTPPHVVPRTVRVAAGIAGIAALGYTAWLARVFVAIVRSVETLGTAWPLPGLFMVVTIAIAVAGGVALLLIAAGKRGGGRGLWPAGGALMGLGILSGFSVGAGILPLGIAFLAAALVATIRRPARIVAGAAVAVAIGAVAFVGTPMLGGLAWIGAPTLPIDAVVPPAGAVDVPLSTNVSIRTKSLPLNDGTSQSLRVEYVVLGIAWWMLAVPGEGGGSGTMSVNGDVGPSTFTFLPKPALEPCRTVAVRAIVRGYRPYRFTFRTICAGP